MRNLQFAVNTLGEGPDCVYIGGCVHGDLIRVGDRFSRTLTVAEWRAGSPDGRPMALVVRSIMIYGKFINQVDPVLSAGLELIPEGEGLPIPGEILVGEDPEAPFPKCEILGTGLFSWQMKPI